MKLMRHSTYKPSELSQISHELRSPLTKIMGIARILSETHLDNQQQEYLDIIVSSADRLLSLENKLHAMLQQGKNKKCS